MLELPELIRKSFLESVPRGFLADMLRALFQAYRDALDMCSGLGAPETIDVLSHNRRACFETSFRNVGKRYKEAIATAELNPRKTSRFSLVRFGQLYMAAARSTTMSTMPRAALYRGNLFRSPQDVFAFALTDDHSDGSMYAILLHGAPAKKKHDDDTVNLAFPSFARIVFPNAHGKIAAGINLFTEVEECREVLHAFMPPTEVTAPAAPRPRRQRKTVAE